MQSITLQTNDTAVAADDQLGQIQFAASSESDGGAAINVSAKIEAVAEAAFQSASHATAIAFSTATSDANAPSERVRISNDGSVGIGTASPAGKLHIQDGTLHILGDGSIPHFELVDTDTNNTLRLNATNSVFAFNLDPDQNIAGSELRFNVDGTDKLTLKHNATVFDQNVTINSSTNQAIIGNSITIFNQGGHNIDFRVEGDTDENLLFCDASLDKVGIGTNSPEYTLHIDGNIGLTNQGFYASPTGVMIGVNGWTYNDGQTTLSHGRFGEDGDAQNSSYVLRCTTTNATFTTAQNNGSDIVLASNRTMMFTANIVGRRTDQVNASNSDNAAYLLTGCLHNDGYGAALVGSVAKTVIAETDSNWDVQATVTGAGAGGTDKLNIQVKGASSKTVNWVVKLDLLEVGGDVSGYTETNILGKIHTEELP